MARSRRLLLVAALFISISVLIGLLLRLSDARLVMPDFDSITSLHDLTTNLGPVHRPFTYKAKPAYEPPPIRDPFQSLLDTGKTPEIPSYNVPEKDLWKQHGLDVAPPLLIGFTRTWPMLLQAVVSYITAGWPPELIYVVENTGVQQANARGQLTLQNPFYMNHTMLKQGLGVNVIQTPTLLNFAQLQNFYLSLTYERGWPYYFWSHMDVLALSHEQGREGKTPAATQLGYKSLYALAVEELGRTMKAEKAWRELSAETSVEENERAPEGKWSVRFFSYDHLTLMNPRAVEDVGGWDSLIPYYITDCDLYRRFDMRGWRARDADAGIIADTSVVLDDLRALYRDPSVEPRFTDPNPPPGKRDRVPSPMTEGGGGGGGADEEIQAAEKARRGELDRRASEMADPVVYWRRLRDLGRNMVDYKLSRWRNTWQLGQHGGQGEPFYYDASGIADAVEILTNAGKRVYKRKWATGECDLNSIGLSFGDQWRVE